MACVVLYSFGGLSFTSVSFVYIRAMREYRFLLLSIVLAVGFFLGDILVPIDVAGGVLYVVAVFVTMWTPHRRLTDVIALLATLFLFVGYVVGPASVDPLVDIINRVLGLFAVWLTAALVDERRGAEEELRRSESKVRSILNATADAIVSLDDADRIETYNPATTAMFGYSRDELQDRGLSELIDPACRDEIEEYLLAVRQKHTNGDGLEIVGRRLDGSTFPLHVTLTSTPGNERSGRAGKPILNGTSSFGGPPAADSQPQITGVLRDLSQQRMLEQEMMRITDRERRRIGHQLHEGLGQMLTGIGLITRSLHQKLRREESPHADEAAHIIGFLQEADEYARDLSLGLVPMHQDATGLSYALQRLAGNISERLGIECLYRHSGMPICFEDPLSGALVYQIVQEAVTSITSTAQPQRVVIELIGSENEVLLTIEDDGVTGGETSSDEGQLPWESVLSHRARMIGATLRASRDENGGLLSCMIPLAEHGLHAHVPATAR